MPTRADRQLRAVRLAKDCFDLGARGRTIHHVTGLSLRELRRLLYADAKRVPRGRAPDSPEWYHGANLLDQAESSLFMSIYRRLRNSGFGAGETLVGAYRHYQGVCHCPSRISFDRAFDLAAHTDGIWVAKTSIFAIALCKVCGGEFLVPHGGDRCGGDNCPFCKLVQRYATDLRVQASFPALQHTTEPIEVQLGIMALVCPGHQAHTPPGRETAPK